MASSSTNTSNDNDNSTNFYPGNVTAQTTSGGAEFYRCSCGYRPKGYTMESSHDLKHCIPCWACQRRSSRDVQSEKETSTSIMKQREKVGTHHNRSLNVKLMIQSLN